MNKGVSMSSQWKGYPRLLDETSFGIYAVDIRVVPISVRTLAWNGRMQPKTGVGVKADWAVLRSAISAVVRGAARALEANAREASAVVNFMIDQGILKERMVTIERLLKSERRVDEWKLVVTG